MTDPTTDPVAAAHAALAALGMTGDQVRAALDAAVAAHGVSVLPTFAPRPCTHPDGCTNPATHQTRRDATPDEAEAHWAALEQHIRESNSGWPAVDYVHPRNEQVTIAEFRCDDPAHADPAYLEALTRQEAADA